MYATRLSRNKPSNVNSVKILYSVMSVQYFWKTNVGYVKVPLQYWFQLILSFRISLINLITYALITTWVAKQGYHQIILKMRNILYKFAISEIQISTSKYFKVQTGHVVKLHLQMLKNKVTSHYHIYASLVRRISVHYINNLTNI